MYTELDMLRINLLGGMDAYVNEYIDDVDVSYLWAVALGSPNGEVDEELIKSVAIDPEQWARACAYFGSLVRVQTMYM